MANNIEIIMLIHFLANFVLATAYVWFCGFKLREVIVTVLVGWIVVFLLD